VGEEGEKQERMISGGGGGGGVMVLRCYGVTVLVENKREEKGLFFVW